jgi:hypothetical protein
MKTPPQLAANVSFPSSPLLLAFLSDKRALPDDPSLQHDLTVGIFFAALIYGEM